MLAFSWFRHWSETIDVIVVALSLIYWVDQRPQA